MSLSVEQRVKFTGLIDGILAASDLNTISAKRIRKELQQHVDYDIDPLKTSLNELIHARFDKFNSELNGDAPPAEPEPPAPITNGVSKASASASIEPSSAPSSPTKKRTVSTPPSESARADSDLSSVAATPPKKKVKKAKSGNTVDDDAAMAARLQAEENSRRARATRATAGGHDKRRKVVKKEAGKRKKKSAARVKDEDDSEVEGEEREKNVNRSGGFHKPLALSAPLSELLNGETQLSRPQCVKKVWEYIKARDLQDPNDKRQIRCDDAMRAVFKTERVHMFTMNKILNQNLYNIDE